MNKFGGRKFVIGLLVLLLGVTADVFVKGGLSSNLLDLLKFVAGGFILGNSAVTVAGILKDAPKPEAAPSADAFTIETPLAVEPAPQYPIAEDMAVVFANQADIKAALAQITTNVATTNQALSYIIARTGLDKPQQNS